MTSMKNSEPTITFMFSDTNIELRFTEDNIDYKFAYVISSPENNDATHLMSIEKVESDIAEAERYQLAILREFDRASVMNFTLYELPGRKSISEFYENFYSGFMICLVERRPCLVLAGN